MQQKTKKLRRSREDTYLRICKLLRFPPNDTITNGYFTRQQMKIMLDFIEDKKETNHVDNISTNGIHSAKTGK